MFCISYFLYPNPYFLSPISCSFFYLLGAAQVDEGRCRPGREHFLEFLLQAINLEASKKNESPESCHIALRATGKKTDHICALYVYVSVCTCHAHKADGSFMIRLVAECERGAENNVNVFFCNPDSNTN